MKTNVPPIKSQGIKTKLVPWIKSVVPEEFAGVWIEPFMGTGAVAFNIAPHRAILCDTNPHLINFYQSLATQEITPELAQSYLYKEGATLLELGEKHYYKIRDRFNTYHKPLDFLFLNRACFNGMIRFNRKGQYNTPFCRKSQRFAQAYVTKITNQIACVCNLLQTKRFTFKCQSFAQTILAGKPEDIIYCDPPYIDRHTDYYNGWGHDDEESLYKELCKTKSKFILSTWHHNDYRENTYIKALWGRFNLLTREHFYHIGASEKNRNPMVEALVTNIEPLALQHSQARIEDAQLLLFEKREASTIR